MKKISLIVCMVAISTIAFSQDCLRVLSTTHFAPELDANGNIASWQLIINYETDGNKSLETTIFCGTDTIFHDCFDHNGDGTQVYSGLVCAGGLDNLSAILQPKTGSCSAVSCGPATRIGGPSGGPLPVVLSSFFGKRMNSNVSISWITASEVNSKEFVLERKTGSSFVTVATIPASGNANGSVYAFTDMNPSKGISQYRLKIVDQNGAYSYSNISAVKGTSTVSDFTVFPNPSNGNAKITISDISEPTYVQLVDISGRVIKNVSVNNSSTVELNGLQKGMYLIRMVNKTSGESVTQKLSVVN